MFIIVLYLFKVLGMVMVIESGWCIGYCLLIFDDSVVICLFGDVLVNYVFV